MADFDITEQHPDYKEWRPVWDLMRDAFSGERAIKAKGETYLPMKAGIKAIKDDRFRSDSYNEYRFRAEFPDIVAPTIRGLAGLIHSKDTTFELPSALESLREEATPSGLTLDQVHRRTTVELLKVGRYGLTPGVDENGKIHLATYTAETIVNWDEGYLVLDESHNARNTETNKWEIRDIYRECWLDERGFVSRVWVKNDKEEWVPGGEEVAIVRGQRALGFLPFVFVGSQDLTPEPDEVPLQGLARLATRAYRLDADFSNTLHMTSEPTPWVAGVQSDKAPQTVGSKALWVLEDAKAKAGFLEFSGQGASAQASAINDTLHRAVMFGAQMFADTRKTAESGEALRLRLGNQTSTLKLIAMASAVGIETVLRNAAEWAGADPEQVKVEPNLDFVDHELTPQEITALVQGWMQGAYSKVTLFENLQRGGIIDPGRDFEDEENLVSEDDPLGVMPRQSQDNAA